MSAVPDFDPTTISLNAISPSQVPFASGITGEISTLFVYRWVYMMRYLHHNEAMATSLEKVKTVSYTKNDFI